MKQKNPLNRFLFKFVVTLSCWLVVIESASAIQLLWQTPQRVGGDGDVRTDGVLVGAYSFGQHISGTTAETVNGVAFKGALFNSTQGHVASSGSTNGYNGFGGAVAPFSAFSSQYKNLLSRGLYRASGPMQLAISGLTANKVYLLQFWLNDARGNPGVTRNQVKFSGAGSTSDQVSPMQAAATPGTVGQYVIGYLMLEAGETGATIVISPDSSSDFTQINAMQIREVSEPSAWLKDEKYGIFVHWLPGLNGVPAVSPTLAQIPSGQSGSAWDAVVGGFDVESFADQVKETGSGYVVFSLGQTTGFYCSYNATYESMTATLPGGGVQGPLARGEFTSHRDLIADLADALNARGIKLLVYLAAEGPKNSNFLRRVPGGQEIYPGLITNARDNDASGNLGSAYSQAFRNKYNAMIEEWSARWGDKVVGWWLDGCWGPSGYSNVGSDNGQGLNNLNALIAATKHGNSSALVACNPGADIFTAISSNQDFLAGELGRYEDSTAKFYEYPSSPYVNLGGKNIQWHVLSYLGTWWARGDLKYVSEELGQYVSSVNKMGGVVSIDVAVDKDGNILPEHFDQMKKLKAFLKPLSAPSVDGEELPSNVNLALYRPAYFRSNVSGNRLSGSMGYQKQPHAGVDGDLSTTAQAGGEYAYSYVVDLERIQEFNRVAVTFLDDTFATSYVIKYSNTGISGPWTDIHSTNVTYSNSTGGLKVHDTDGVKSGRWIMIKSLAPNASGQFGGQMAIAELAVFNAGGAVQSSQETIWIDDDVPTGSVLSASGSGAAWNWASLMDSNWGTLNIPGTLSGLKVHWSPPNSGQSEHWFETNVAPLSVGVGDILYCYLWIDPIDMPGEILLSWKDSSNSWAHRAFWGSNIIASGGTVGTNSLRYRGAIPVGGGAWVLSVPASEVGLEGVVITGMKFSTYGGRVIFDRAGRSNP